MAFPNIPNVPGVPALPRLASAVPEVVQLLTGDAGGLFSGLAGPEWGLFLNGVPVVTAETVVSFEYKQGYAISDFPIEPSSSTNAGGFESYNKVQRPFNVRLRFATGGTLADRQALLDSAQAAVDSLDLMDAVTPETTYTSVNPVNLDYRRTSVNGVGLIVVDILCEQVRVTASSSFTTSNTNATGANPAVANSVGNTASANQNVSDRFPTAAQIVQPQSPSASAQANGGTVQPVPTAPGQFDLSQALP